MPDPIFDDPRLAALYDLLDPDRSDLDVYGEIVAELGATSVLDVGCGTGTFAVLLAGRGIEVLGVDPALASLDVARGKRGAGAVTWVHGVAASLPPVQVDVAVMTANVAQAIVEPSEWAQTLAAVHRSVRPGGHLVFETRIPAARAWEEWDSANAPVAHEIEGVGRVETSRELIEVAPPLVTFRWTVTFASDAVVLTSTSTLRFRERDEVERDLAELGFEVREVRDAPDRPGREWVFVARRPGP